MAMMMARLYTGAHDIVTLRNAYHGLSGGCSRRLAAGCVPNVCGTRSAAILSCSRLCRLSFTAALQAASPRLSAAAALLHDAHPTCRGHDGPAGPAHLEVPCAPGKWAEGWLGAQ